MFLVQVFGIWLDPTNFAIQITLTSVRMGHVGFFSLLAIDLIKR